MADQSWAMKGELVLSCNCTVFCPCVLSLGSHPPTEGYCQTWAGFRVDSGHFGDVDLSGLNLGLIMEIPGYMSRGNWTAGLFIDKRASIYAVKAIDQDFHRQGRRHHLAAVDPGRQVPRRRAGADHLRDQGQDAHLPDSEDHRRRGDADRRQGPRARHDDPNSEYWIAPEIIVAKSDKSRMRAFGRNWNFAGRSAEICKLDWRGP